MKKILVITPRFPIPTAGACEQDRFEGIRQLKRLGFDVLVIGKVFSFQDKGKIFAFGEKEGVRIELLNYETEKKRNLWRKALFYLRRLANPFYWDGAAYEYSHKDTKKLLEKTLDEWRPDLVWFDYTYLWSLYSQVKKRKIPIVARSINFEASHFLQEDGYTFFNLLKSIPKYISEFIVGKKSDVLFAITPREERIYKKFGAKNVITLPLRGLPSIIKENKIIQDKKILDVFFMGSTYNVHHNREALEIIIKEIAPKTEKIHPKKFKFHILGNKIPAEFNRYFNDSVVYVGPKYGDELEKTLLEMDIALIPSLFGAGMQQKIFEPLCRGIPTITSARGLAGYPFEGGQHLLLAKDVEGFTSNLSKLQNRELRKKLSQNSINLCQSLFEKGVNDSTVLQALKKLDMYS